VVHLFATLRTQQRASVGGPLDTFALEIEEDDGAYFLYRLDAKGACIGDTWHQTIEEAKAQAKFEFDIEDADWT